MNTYITSRIAVATTGIALAILPFLAGAQVVQSNIPLCEITRGLAVGATGEDVRCLQRYLNWAGFQVSASGAGSPGNETQYFGERTRAAVAAWQNANAASVLTPLGLSAGTGFWGSASFAKYVLIVRAALGVS